MIESPWFHSLLFESGLRSSARLWMSTSLDCYGEEKNNFMFVVILKVSSQEEFFHCD